MPSLTEWKVPPAFQPRASDYNFDLDKALSSVVGLHSIIPPDAFSAETLGTERAGNGVLTITRGTLPLALFGAAGYGQRQGWLMLPGRLTAALAPWSFGVLLAGLGTQVLWVSAGLGLSAVLALMAIQPRTSEGS